ncbi:hypothetical protein P5757_17350 [Bacillus tropicus]|nr:hypothetical protein [Bacillus tropicus]MDF9553704.1 hypothetical protein [Bacillus tropicus]MDF9590549.1 hypothetical protein [Bacillus tropicus]MDF9645140.1 hypothetical protein [Bacillus tropicus]
MEETIVIANELGIKHPTNPKNGRDYSILHEKEINGGIM